VAPVAVLLGVLLGVAGAAVPAARAAGEAPAPGDPGVASRHPVGVPGGVYSPFYRVAEGGEVRVEAFELDARPVTNEEFLAFVRDHPEWRRSAAPELFRDDAYLSHWAGDLELGPDADAHQPVTFVSYFAAAAFCRAEGGRLPTEAEWEWAADPAREGGPAEARAEQRILAFYARPKGHLPRVGAGAPNALGLHDLHGVIWEWVSDFDASFAAADSRQTGDRDLRRVCGGAAIAADDAQDYAAFMRFAFRSSLEARYAMHHLGFRCARSLS